MQNHITVIGGGIGGLTAAIECAEAGAAVTLFEAHSTPGGRGRATRAPYVAHDGAHVFYADGPHYHWLKRHGFVRGQGIPGPVSLAHIGFRVGGRIRALPPVSLLRAQLQPGVRAPVDRDFHSWASEKFGEDAARMAANAISVATYDADTGDLSAAFVWELFRRVLGPKVPGVRWVRGGWQTVIDRMVARAVEVGVTIELGARVEELPATPVIIATELASARKLLNDDTLTWRSGHCVMLDVAVRKCRGDYLIASDLDEGGFHECYTMQDRTIAPAGESLFQIDMPVRVGETAGDAHQRLRRFTDTVIPGWTERVTWQRTATARGRTGALDLPGQTWRDRPAVDRGNDVWVAGDMMAAPGMRGEIAINSALTAARGALESARLVR